MGPLALAGIQAGISAIPMFFGENNIFSGKKRAATRERERIFRESQNYQLPTEYQEAYQSALQQENIGLPSSVLGLYRQNMARQEASQLGALRSRRSLLAGLSPIVQGGQDAALKLAGMQAEALRQGKSYADQMRMRMGGLKQQEFLRKSQEAAEYQDVQRRESDLAISNALQGIGSAVGSFATNQMYTDIYGGSKEPSEAAKLRGLKRSFRQAGLPRTKS
jgi:hypothetical protein